MSNVLHFPKPTRRDGLLFAGLCVVLIAVFVVLPVWLVTHLAPGIAW